MLKQFYVYLWLRQDGTPYYVGKGQGDRAYRSSKSHRPPTDKSLILLQEFPNEADALAAEVFLIAYYGRYDIGMGRLRNRTDGGEGISNPSPETRQKLSAAASLRTMPVTLKERLRLIHLGMKHSPVTRDKMRGPRKPYKKRRPYILGTRHPHSPEIKQRMSESAKRRVLRDGVSQLVEMGKKGAAVRWHTKEN